MLLLLTNVVNVNNYISRYMVYGGFIFLFYFSVSLKLSIIIVKE